MSLFKKKWQPEMTYDVQLEHKHMATWVTITDQNGHSFTPKDMGFPWDFTTGAYRSDELARAKDLAVKTIKEYERRLKALEARQPIVQYRTG